MAKTYEINEKHVYDIEDALGSYQEYYENIAEIGPRMFSAVCMDIVSRTNPTFKGVSEGGRIAVFVKWGNETLDFKEFAKEMAKAAERTVRYNEEEGQYKTYVLFWKPSLWETEKPVTTDYKIVSVDGEKAMERAIAQFMQTYSPNYELQWHNSVVPGALCASCTIVSQISAVWFTAYPLSKE